VQWEVDLKQGSKGPQESASKGDDYEEDDFEEDIDNLDDLESFPEEQEKSFDDF